MSSSSISATPRCLPIVRQVNLLHARLFSMTPLRNPCQSASVDEELHATEPKSGLFVPPNGAECIHKSMSGGVLYRTVLILCNNFSITFQVLRPKFHSLEPDNNPQNAYFLDAVTVTLTLTKQDFQEFFYSCNCYHYFSCNLFLILIDSDLFLYNGLITIIMMETFGLCVT